MSPSPPMPRLPLPFTPAHAAALALLAAAPAASVAPAHAQDTSAPAPAPTTAPAPSQPGTTDGAGTTPVDPGAGGSDRDKRKAAAQLLLSQGVELLAQLDYQGALDRFVAAYELFPSPKILLNIGSTLRDMGRLADAANTYQLFIEAPDTAPERVAEVKELLNRLDDELYLVAIKATPPGTEVSIDGGPWINLGDRKLVTRLGATMHLVRARKAGLAPAEVTLSGFAGEKRDLELALVGEEAPALAAGTTTPTTPTTPTDTVATANPTSTGAGATTPTAEAGSPDAEPRAITAWLVTGVKAERGGVRYQTTAPRIRIYDDGGVAVGSIEVGREPWLGASAQLRIDGKGRGAAAAFALSIAASRRVELELAVLLSNDLGGYVGARGHLLRGPIRPVLSAGVPLFYSGGEPRVGVRGAVGLELTINGHLGVVGEVGAEHFFNPQLGYEANAVVPVVGVIGRL